MLKAKIKISFSKISVFLFLLFVILIFLPKYSFGAVWDLIENVGQALLMVVSEIIRFVLDKIAWVLGKLIDAVLRYDVFDEESGTASFLWDIFLNLSYPLLIFGTLIIAFRFILGKGGDVEHRLLFNIVLVALLINFTFAIMKGLYEFTLKKIEKSFLGNLSVEEQGQKIEAGLGTALYYAFFKGIPSPSDLKFQDSTTAYAAAVMILTSFAIFAVIILTIIFFLALGRIFWMSLLTGISPLALVSAAIPWLTKRFGGKDFSYWTQETIKWLTLIPILIFLILIGLSLGDTFANKFVASSNVGADRSFFGSLINWGLTFAFIIGWMSISITFAIQSGGYFGKMGKRLGFTIARFASLGAMFPFRYAMRKIGMVSGSGIKKIGGGLKKTTFRIPFLNRTVGRQIRALGETLENAGQKISKPALEKIKTDYQRLVSAGKAQEALRTYSAYIDEEMLKSIKDSDLLNFITENQGERFQKLNPGQKKLIQDRIEKFNEKLMGQLIDNFGNLSGKVQSDIIGSIDKRLESDKGLAFRLLAKHSQSIHRSALIDVFNRRTDNFLYPVALNSPITAARRFLKIDSSYHGSMIDYLIREKDRAFHSSFVAEIEKADPQLAMKLRFFLGLS